MDDESRPITDAAECAYELDANFRILRVDQRWAVVARSNGAPQLIPPPGPIGQSAVSCATDMTSALIYERLFTRVLETGRAIAIAFRCDAPALRLYMNLSIEPRSGEGLRVETTLTRAEERPPMALLDPEAPRGSDLLLMCGWCKSVEVAGRWVEVEEAVAALGLFERLYLPRVTHGMCPPCYERVCQEIDGL